MPAKPVRTAGRRATTESSEALADERVVELYGTMNLSLQSNGRATLLRL
jgi:hypothetical protein